MDDSSSNNKAPDPVPDPLGVRKGTKAIVGAIRKRKRTARTVAIAVLGVLLFQVLLAAVMSIPATQEILSSRIREALEAKLGISAEIGYVSIGLFPPRVIAERVHVIKIDGVYKTNSAAAGNTAPSGEPRVFDLPFMESASLGIGELDIGLDILSLFSSPFQPVQSIGLRDVRIAATDPGTLQQIFDFMNRPHASSTQQNDVWPLIQKFIGIAPARIKIENFELIMGQATAANYVGFVVDSIELLRNRKNEVAALISVGKSTLKYERMPTDLDLRKLNIEARMRPDRAVLLDRLALDSNAITGEVKGSITIPEVGRSVTAVLQPDLEVDAALLGIFNQEASGKIQLQGRASINEVLKNPDGAAPSHAAQFEFEGRTKWKSVIIENFDVYDGLAEFSISDTNLNASHIEVRTPKGAALAASGSMVLTGTIPFSLKAKITNFPFSELMKGLNAPTNAIDFLISMDELKVDGEGDVEDRDKSFRLDFSGALTARRLIVPSIENSGQSSASSQVKTTVHYALPDCAIQLGLKVNAELLNFDGSTAGCQGESAPNVLVNSGRIDLNNGKTNFSISATDFDMAPTSYFARKKIQGLAKRLDGRIFSAAGSSDVTFDARVDAKNFSFDEIGPAKIATNLQINEQGLTLTDIAAQAEGDVAKGLKLQSRRVFVSFGSKPSAFNLSARGQLAALQGLAPGYPIFADLSGEVERLDADWEMELGSLQVVGVQARAKVSNFALGPFRSVDASADLACGDYVCANSFIRFRGAGIGVVPKGMERGSVTVVLKKLAYSNLSIGVSSSELPVYLDSDGKPRGLVNGRMELVSVGAEQRLVPTGTLRLDDFEYGDQSLGNIVVAVAVAQRENTATGKAHLVASFSSFFDALSGKATLPLSGSDPMHIDILAKGFDPMFLLPSARIERSLYSSISGTASVDAVSPLGNWSRFSGRPWYSDLRLKSTIQEALLTSDSVSIKATKPVKLDMESNVIRIRNIALSTQQDGSPGSLLTGSFTHDFAAGNGEGDFSGSLNLARLAGLLPGTERAEGTLSLKSKVIFQNHAASLDGEVNIDARRLRFQGLDPDFEDVKGRLVLAGDRVEIVRMTGRKGTGAFEILGSMRLPMSALVDSPEFGVRARLDKIQTRLPAPIFRSVDATLSGNIELNGVAKPYDLRGGIVINRARAFRDLTCDEIVAAVPQNTKERVQLETTPWFSFDIAIDANESIQLLTKCVRAAVSARLRVLGNNQALRFSGKVAADSGRVQVLKANFEIQKAEVIFDSPIAFDPRLDIQMTSQIEGYQIFMNLDGYSSSPRTSFWSEPATTPWGAPVGQAELLRMIASGRAPKSEAAGGSALASQVANYVYGSTALDESISKAFSKLTAGFVETVRLQPIIENGQTAWKASLSRSVGDRFNLGLDVEQSPLVNNQSLTGTLYLNQTVNVLGGFDRKSNQSESYLELSGGLRFMFGGK
jgi:hypothetical protein